MNKKIYDLITNGKIFSLNEDLSSIPQKGIYFVLDKNENIYNTKRIVYIGNSKNLQKRLHNHKRGKSALSDQIRLCFDENEQNNTITNYIIENLLFIVVDVNDDTNRRDLEKKLIGTIAQNSTSLASPQWLGNQIRGKKFQVWNTQHVTCSDAITQQNYDILVKGLIK